MTRRIALWTALVLLGGCADRRSASTAPTTAPQASAPNDSGASAATTPPQPDPPEDDPIDAPEPVDEPESVDVTEPTTSLDYSPPLDKFSRPPPDVQIAAFTVEGGLEYTAVLEAVKTNFHYMHYCYNQALARNPDQGGDLVILYTISSSGEVTKAKGTKSTLRNKNLVRCAVKASEQWTYPKPEDGQTVEVRLTVRFTPPKSDDERAQ